MNSSGGAGSLPAALSPAAQSLLWEGINLVFARWTALQLAIENQTGGRESRRKSEDFASAVLSWFHSKDLYKYDLHSLLDEKMDELFYMVLKDDSIEQVANVLINIHQECLKGSSESVERLRKQGHERNAVRQSKRVIADADDETSDEEISDMNDETSDEEISDMMVDEPKAKGLTVDQPKSVVDMPDGDGWSVVSRKNKGKRHG